LTAAFGRFAAPVISRPTGRGTTLDAIEAVNLVGAVATFAAVETPFLTTLVTDENHPMVSRWWRRFGDEINEEFRGLPSMLQT
jgi:hypothetical protein